MGLEYQMRLVVASAFFQYRVAVLTKQNLLEVTDEKVVESLKEEK